MPRRLSSIAVYCGSSPGRDPQFAAAAAAFGKLLGERDLRLVYGGGHVGLMGVLADAVLASGGEVLGVITRALEEKEVAHQGLTELVIAATMHERKARMADAADAVVMLPGSFGTLDEFFEAVTWTQLGVHTKPCGILDVAGYFDGLTTLLRRSTDEGFLRREHLEMVVIEADAEALLDSLESWEPAVVDKWLDRTDR